MHDMPDHVSDAFAGLPASVGKRLQAVRADIFKEAHRLGVGPLTETLKWGQPSYLTQASKAGTTLRLGALQGEPAVFVHCQTSIIAQTCEVFGEAARVSGSRALFLDSDPRVCAYVIGAALTYHKRANPTPAAQPG